MHMIGKDTRRVRATVGTEAPIVVSEQDRGHDRQRQEAGCVTGGMEARSHSSERGGVCA